jgi:hypothetical protein
LEQSINHYRTASGLTNSPLLLLDSTYNRAQSLIALADILDDTEPASPEPKAQALRAEASTILSEVLDGQEAFLSRQAEQGDDAIEEVEAGADETSMEVDQDGDEDQDGEEETFETYLPTPSTFIDTALALVDLSLSTWESIEPLQPPTEQAQAFVRNVLDRATRLCPSDRQPELDLTEIKVLMSVDGIVWDMYRSEAKVGSGIESSLEGATLVLTKLLASLDQPSSETGETTTPTAESNLVRAEILTTLAETHMTIADRLTFLHPYPFIVISIYLYLYLYCYFCFYFYLYPYLFLFISLSPSLSLSLALSLSLFLFLFLSLSISISLSLYLSIAVYLHLYIHLYPSISLYPYPFIVISIYLYLYLYRYFYLYIYLYLYRYLTISNSPSISISIYISTRQSVPLYLSLYL